MNVHQTEIHRQNAAAAAIRDRLMNPSQWVRKSLLDETNVKLADAEAVATLLEVEVRKLTAERDRLLLDVADRDARVLAQMERICSLENIGIEDKSGKKRIADIVMEVLKDFPDVTWKEIISIHRAPRLVRPRQLCMFEIYRQRPDLSFPALGRIFGGRDHTTIMYSVRKIESEAAQEQESQ